MRVYYATFKGLVLDYRVKRAAVLLGPRRVGKTVMVRQLIHDAVSEGISPKCILYASIDAPVYSDVSLEKFISLILDQDTTQKKLVIFDEIQYMKGWEVHLKDL